MGELPSGYIIPRGSQHFTVFITLSLTLARIIFNITKRGRQGGLSIYIFVEDTRAQRKEMRPRSRGLLEDSIQTS